MRLIYAVILLFAYASGVASAQRHEWGALFVCSLVVGMCLMGIHLRTSTLARRAQQRDDERARQFGGEV